MRSSNTKAEAGEAPARSRSTPRRSTRRTFSAADSQSDPDEPFEAKPRQAATPQARGKIGYVCLLPRWLGRGPRGGCRDTAMPNAGAMGLSVAGARLRGVVRALIDGRWVVCGGC